MLVKRFFIPAFLFIFLVFCVKHAVLAAELESTETTPATTEVETAAEVTADSVVETPVEADAEPLSAWKHIEKRIDSVFGTFNGAIASILFYPVGERKATASLPTNVIDEDAVAAMMDRIAKQGKSVQDASFVLKVPEGSLSKTALAKLQKECEQRYVHGIGHSFAVEEFEGGTLAEQSPTLILTWSGIPMAVLWLAVGAGFFTLRMGFINLRGFKHAILVTSGRYDDPNVEGEVSHFQALTAALSATVGLGNIAGVAIAVSLGGPGATFWMIIAGLLGMSSKFAECTLGQKYRQVRPDGRVMGGAMYYLSIGLREMGLGKLASVLGVVFAILCIGGSFAGGNAFQVNQSLNAVRETIPFIEGHRWVYGLVMTVLVGIVIIGGIRRIAATAEKIVPLMCGIYVLAALAILVMNCTHIPAAMTAIFQGAFTPQAGYGGVMGVLVVGFQRAAFSNEAGIGSAAIAHSAARTEYPAREGIVALLEPFIDTVVVCTMTALVIVITGAYDVADPQYTTLITAKEGAALTSRAMAGQIPHFDKILAIAVMLFAYSTMISWSYYGERCWAYLFGDQASMSYRIIFLVFVFLGSIVSATNVLEFGDLMILGMAFPNILGVVLLSGKVKKELDRYWQLHKAGQFEQSRPK